jgi:hypothetical protein
VLVWVGLVPASLLFGPVVRAVSPLRTLATLLGRSGGGTVSLSRAPGGVAGCGGLFAFLAEARQPPVAIPGQRPALAGGIRGSHAGRGGDVR